MLAKSKTIFQLSAYQTDIQVLKDTLVEPHLSQINALLAHCRKKVGVLQDLFIHPYRVSQTNYVKVTLIGELGKLTFTFVIAGYTEYPAITENALRIYLYVVDTADCYWFIELLKSELSTKSVDNAVKNNQEPGTDKEYHE
ncbi:hypothetical protein BKG93_05965 [Rodentibacter ratti]|uniref:Uncharacterized protein n=2 Tax=Rodentibacter TaxID=1960084 RepID=A0A1V3L4D5_9PAST|nr:MULTISPECIES: hypothetical protein [Rodentibacter]MDC2825912.1 hypothetical protein [Rodentibacter pneumotropicus]OOF79673.1 hypothetical protein BKG96_01360 [Rodentibacter heylii]OOF84799.1 hypothetical protein BKG93_05965 [Rodentibacter ratti]QIA76783.1 hypothetical protein FEE42_05135 [Rodentibacter heylii]